MITPTSPPAPWQRPHVSPATQTLTGDGAVSLAVDTTYLDSITPKNAENPEDPYVVTLANGNSKRQTKQILIPASTAENTAKWKVDGTFVGFVSLGFSDIATSVVLVWDGGGWQYVGGNALKNDQ